MKIIPRNVHGLLDYIVGVLLIAAPWVLGFADDAAATYVPIALGGLTLLYSIFTDYEFGLIKSIPFGAHMVLDLLSGLFLAVSPWALGFVDRVVWPHLAVGIFEVLVVLMTRNSARVATTGIGASTTTGHA